VAKKVGGGTAAKSPRGKGTKGKKCGISVKKKSYFLQERLSKNYGRVLIKNETCCSELKKKQEKDSTLNHS